jgi:hypothetical protein
MSLRRGLDGMNSDKFPPIIYDWSDMPKFLPQEKKEEKDEKLVKKKTTEKQKPTYVKE